MSARTPWWVLVIAAAFVAYFGLLLYCDIRRPVDFGFEAGYSTGRMVVTGVVDGTPAARSGLAAGDVIEAADGRPIRTLVDWTAVDSNVEFDRPIAITVWRGGARIAATIALPPAPWSYWRTTPGIFLLAALSIQLASLGFAVLIVLKRPNDAVARCGAWLLASVAVFKIVLPYRIAAVWRAWPALAGAALWIPHLSDFAVGAVLFTFFANFPRQVVRSRALWVAAWTPMLLALVKPTQFSAEMVYAPEHAAGAPWQGLLLTVMRASYTAAALTVLMINYRRLIDVNERRRVKILVLGALGGLAPGLLVVASFWLTPRTNLTRSIFASPVTALGTVSLLLFPASFAYAILRHRLFDVGMMIRQGVQYALARRVIVWLIPAAGALLVVDVVLHGNQPLTSVLRTRGWIYAIAGGLAWVAHRRRQHWLSALDRRFFREQYDARRILHQVAEDVRDGRGFQRVAVKVVAQIDAALHPRFVALLLREPDAMTYDAVAASSTVEPFSLRVDSTLASLLRVFGKPLEVSAGVEWLRRQLPADEVAMLEQRGIDLLVPIATRPDRAESMLVLGVKRSDEPYSTEDCDLLATIALNLGMLLDRPATAEPIDETFEECPACGRCYDTAGHCEHDSSALTTTRLSRLLAGRYQLDRRLGQGGLGTVYAALDTALERRVAVKVIRDEFLTHADVARRFHREARIAAAFEHPHVVTVFDFGIVAELRAYLVMELLSGRTLRDELRRRTRLPLGDAHRVIRDVCSAIESAHRRHLVHRDLKPENIFLAESDAGSVAKVLDFGLAKMVATVASADTRVGIVAGTLSYMAPEQLRGEDAGPACDVWALAIVLYEMLTGVHPFSTLEAPRHAVLSPKLSAFFERALAMKPAERPSSPAEFLRHFEQAAA